MTHNLYSGFAIQNTFMSTAIIGRMVLQRHYPLSAILLTSLSIFAQLPTLRWNIFLTKALLAIWVIPNWFSRFCSQNGYLNSKLMLRWDGHFKRQRSRKVKNGIFERNSFSMITSVFEMIEQFFATFATFVTCRKCRFVVWSNLYPDASFDAVCWRKRKDTNPTPLSHLDLKLLAKNCWWPRVTSMTLRGVNDEKIN